MMAYKTEKKSAKYIGLLRTLMALGNRGMCVGVILLSMLAGCNSQQEHSDLKNSGILLYPVVKAGDMISGLGQALRHLSTPGSWSGTPDDRFVKAITPEQVLLYEQSGAIPVSRDYLNEKKGMGFGVEHLPDPMRPFVKMVEQITGYQFNWYLHPRIDDMAMAMPNGVIFINPLRMDDLSGEAQLLVALHEAAHHTLRHTDGFGVSEIIDTPSVPWVQPAKEMVADRQAAIWMVGAGIQSHRIVFAATTLLADQVQTPHHPAGKTRLDHIRLTLAEFQANGMIQVEPEEPATPVTPNPSSSSSSSSSPVASPATSTATPATTSATTPATISASSPDDTTVAP